MITAERRAELLAMRGWRERDAKARERRAMLRVLPGGRLGVPRALDAALEQRPRPALRLLRGGRADEPIRRVPPIVVELPRRRSRA